MPQGWPAMKSRGSELVGCTFENHAVGTVSNKQATCLEIASFLPTINPLASASICNVAVAATVDKAMAGQRGFSMMRCYSKLVWE